MMSKSNATPTANLSLVVRNLTQHFRLSRTETVSWFVAEGELVQFDENFDQVRTIPDAASNAA